MLRLRPLLLAPLALMFATTQANAAVMYSADLTGAQENPPRATTAFGFATFILNDTATAFSFTATIFGIDVTGTQTPDTTADNLTAAHIHAPAPPGTNTGVVWGFVGNPFNNTNMDGTMTPFATGAGGVFTGTWDATEGNNTTLLLQLPNLYANMMYINFHTTQAPGGEIRGQITPEPTSLLLLATGLFGLARARRRLR